MFNTSGLSSKILIKVRGVIMPICGIKHVFKYNPKTRTTVNKYVDVDSGAPFGKKVCFGEGNKKSPYNSIEISYINGRPQETVIVKRKLKQNRFVAFKAKFSKMFNR